MANVVVCDGCGAAIAGKQPEVTVVRKDSFASGPWPLPHHDEPLQWCINCALVATHAVVQAVKNRTDDEHAAHAVYRLAYRHNPIVANKPRPGGTIGVVRGFPAVV